MIHQNFKNVYYSLFYFLSLPLKPVYRLHYFLFLNHKRKIHVGCGTKYLPGFINIDGNFGRRADYLLDVRAGLPFPANSIEVIYSCHMLEHLHITEAMELLKEWRRALAPSGYVRLVLPDFATIHDILSGKASETFPRKFRSKTGQAINYLFCDGQHKFAYSRELLEELAKDAGFGAVEPADPVRDKNISDQALDEPKGSLCVNLFK